MILINKIALHQLQIVHKQKITQNNKLLTPYIHAKNLYDELREHTVRRRQLT